MNDLAEGYAYPPRVTATLAQHERGDYRRAALALNARHVDLVLLQHEYGIFGGSEGDYILGLLQELHAPVVTTLHTVLPAPAPVIRAAVREIAEQSAAVVVMTHGAARLLSSVYGVDPEKVRVIPHGVPVMAHGNASALRDRLGLCGRTVVSTFGLVDPRKGLEFMIDAMEVVAARHPEALYLILGRTHPELVAREGERYRPGPDGTT